jgi:hypothetical protein
MPSSPVAESLFTLHLQPGQHAWQHLPRGAELVVADGAVCLHRREYLAGMWVALPVLLRAGERHRVEEGGWLQMEAVVGAGVARVSAVAQQRGGWGVAARLLRRALLF